MREEREWHVSDAITLEKTTKQGIKITSTTNKLLLN